MCQLIPGSAMLIFRDQLGANTYNGERDEYKNLELFYFCCVDYLTAFTNLMFNEGNLEKL